MLVPRSFAASLAPAKTKRMQATMLMMRVNRRTSHSWYSLVMSGCESCGISSCMEWKIKG